MVLTVSLFLSAPDAPPHLKGPPFFPFFASPLCFFPLCSPALLLFLPPLCMLWYADMQEFLGLKMIDQT